ncbi:hypothetical protein [Sphingomonas glaciei]|uniref:DUF4131 domain-containing protein n=1 Tax=Sphingomonas glaciei TaxID=2938948 RepID=A0ABY5MVC3_9SPHN|nr:hypothetical protein [Sphingomonas glaciei]UUR08062.1 hypothetical protein M1K48_14245 [Sphingomonas glaciei]
MMARLIPEEKIGIGLTLLAMALGLAGAYLYQRFWILSFIPFLLLFIVFLGFAIGKIIDATKDRDLAPSLRWRKALAVPLMVGGFWAVDGLTALTSRTSAQAFLFSHREAMNAAERKVGPGQAVAMRYLEGIPDGGVAIIRSDLEPTRLPVQRQLELVGENMNRCRPLLGRDWLCGYD